MLRITVELVPFGNEDRKSKIAEMVIANTGRTEDCAYMGWTAPDDWSREPARFGKLFEFDRRQSVWELIRLMLEAIRLEDHKPTRKKDSLAQILRKRLFR